MERTAYMQKLMNDTYPDVAIEAIKGGFEGAWERVISRKIKEDYTNGHSEAEVILQAAGGSTMKAAKLITNSKIPDHANA